LLTSGSSNKSRRLLILHHLTLAKISSLFQSFYARTFSLLPTLIPSSSISGINLQPLLTTTEISDRKRLRTENSLKRAQWEEEIERRVTSEIYDRIFRPRTADDEERDMKLHGKIQALVVMGVTLEHLGVDLTTPEKMLLEPAIESIGRGDILMWRDTN
jgi:hypothetical protein